MRIHLQVGLRLLDEDLHFILIQAFVAAELQLGRAVLKVNVTDCVSDVATPVARLCPLEGSSTALGEARLGTESNSLGGAEGLLLVDFPVAPVAGSLCVRGEKKERVPFIVFSWRKSEWEKDLPSRGIKQVIRYGR